MRKLWGSESVVVRKMKYEPAEKDVFTALSNGEKVGLVIFCYDEAHCEIMNLTVSSTHPQVGKQMILSAIGYAKNHNSEIRFMVTTNDNTNTLRFYRNMEFHLQELRMDIVKESRQIKSQIPLVGYYHIPIRDEIELEMVT